jgi:hypothetical protein
MCALKTALAQVKIYGPSGDLHASRYTQVPRPFVHANDQHHVGEKEGQRIGKRVPVPEQVGSGT